ncbi:DUF3786 domain-containing protein [Thermosediminibacter oceani]|uniref:DUF3786 domain-containing protein n=1 Tax=Thermosediminibacter oceani (strain ATCC BAA-1034 / DSM 16646 / JW/IW-1228P) TaxID=555079 RepID=D9S299_THEOJ|nr:DUF3786 domain-containing protein [Thermosediminibacter oceani]ADL07526.1 conserved hypothetical protein [Thermosediminibacter oceani DSM 16646]
MDNKKNEGAYFSAFSKSRDKLARLAPQDIARSALCEYDGSRMCFYLKSFNHSFQISYPEGDIFFLDSGNRPPLEWRLILLNYLSGAKDIPLSKKWVSYRELPDGNVFFPSIKTYVLDVLSKYYAVCDKDRLYGRLVHLGFNPEKNKADLSAEGLFTPRIPIKIQFWEGEDVIPPSCQILFDTSISCHMHIEDIVALCGLIRDLLISAKHSV